VTGEGAILITPDGSVEEALAVAESV
jgi:hypothetical protein